jgi:hypothetical protein
MKMTLRRILDKLFFMKKFNLIILFLFSLRFVSFDATATTDTVNIGYYIGDKIIYRNF